jgi:hypothetical protein
MWAFGEEQGHGIELNVSCQMAHLMRLQECCRASSLTEIHFVVVPAFALISRVSGSV